MFKKKITALFSALLLSSALLAGCGSNAATEAESSSAAESTVQEESSSEAENSASASSLQEETEPEDETASASSEDTEAEESSQTSENAYGLEDGTYTVEIDTDSGMFHVNEALAGKGTLTVENGEMTVHMTLAGTGILNLYQGTAEEAQEEDAELIEYTVDTVTYSDGITEEVYGFDVPCPVLDEEFPVAIIGKKQKWYDHTVIVSNPVPEE